MSTLVGIFISYQGLFPAALLHEAVDKGDIREVQTLLERGVDIDAKNEEGWAALHLVVLGEDVKMAQLLIEQGASLEIAATSHGQTPLHMAVLRGREEMMRLLIEAGVEVDKGDATGCTPLYYGVDQPLGEGWTSISDLVTLLQAGASINAQNLGGNTPLHGATYQGDLEVVAFLIKNGASVSIRNKKGETPLYNAVYQGDINMVKALIKAGARIDVKNKAGITPLVLAQKLLAKRTIDWEKKHYQDMIPFLEGNKE